MQGAKDAGEQNRHAQKKLFHRLRSLVVPMFLSIGKRVVMFCTLRMEKVPCFSERFAKK